MGDASESEDLRVTTYHNPIIPGSYPDPSICRVGKDYYLVTSSFEYFPGVPIFHSRDLIHWRQIGHCLTRSSQLPLDRVPTSNGICAPTIRYHQGEFYMVTTNITRGGHFYVMADDPAGEWSDPVWVKGEHFDPDLFFDDNGKVYFSHMNMAKGITQYEIDIASGRLVTHARTIWTGFEDRYCEGPHLYKINGWYYLIVAEGGTYRSHMIVAARSKHPTGPFEGCPHNPLLTHRCAIGNPIYHTGHGDLVQAHDGSWWIVFLAVRLNDVWFHLGRETFLAPVSWTNDGWPVINGGNLITLEMEANVLPAHPFERPLTRDDFNSACLGMQWNFRRNPASGCVSLSERAGFLCLRGNENSLNDSGPLAFVGRQQQEFACRARTCVEFDAAGDDEEAGLTVFMNESHHYEIAITRREGKRVVIARKRIGDLSKEIAVANVNAGRVVLGIDAEPNTYTFCYGTNPQAMSPLATGLSRYLSDAVSNTGVYFGMYATGNGRPCTNPAYFDWFNYESV